MAPPCFVLAVVVSSVLEPLAVRWGGHALISVQESTPNRKNHPEQVWMASA